MLSAVELGTEVAVLRLVTLMLLLAPGIAASQVMPPHAPGVRTVQDSVVDAEAAAATRAQQSGDSDGAAARPARAPTLSATSLGALLLGGVIANAAFEVQRDPGGYQDLWYTRDKRIHLGLSFGFSAAGSRLGVDDRAAAVMVCGAGALFELSQAMGGGHVSALDIHANCLGAAMPVLWNALRRPTTAR